MPLFIRYLILSTYAINYNLNFMIYKILLKITSLIFLSIFVTQCGISYFVFIKYRVDRVICAKKNNQFIFNFSTSQCHRVKRAHQTNLMAPPWPVAVSIVFRWVRTVVVRRTVRIYGKNRLDRLHCLERNPQKKYKKNQIKWLVLKM